MMIVHKDALVTRVKHDTRTVWGRVCDYGCDRDGEILRKSCFDDRTIEKFMKNPVLGLSHDFKSISLGKVKNFIVSEFDVVIEAVIARLTAAQHEFWNFIKFAGVYGFSVSFIPKRWQDIKVKDLTLRERISCEKRGKKSEDIIRVYESIDLLEISAVAIPSCPTCLLISYKDGRVKNKCLNGACELVLNKEKKEPKVNVEAVKTVVVSVLKEVVTEALKQHPTYDVILNTVGKEVVKLVYGMKKKVEYRDKVIDYAIESTIPRHYRGRYRARLKAQIKSRVKNFL